MTCITIFTKRYKDKLLGFFDQPDVSYGKAGEEHFFSLPYRSFKDIITYERLENALEDIILGDNNAIKGSEKAILFMKNVIFKPYRKSILYDLASSIECLRELNVDGYIDFRMQKYSLEIDRILYSAVKKSGDVPKV